MKEITKKEISLWVHYHNFLAKAIMIAGASLLLIIIGIIPMTRKFYATRQLYKKEQEKLEVLAKKVVVVDNLDPNILEERVRLLNKVLPPNKDVVVYLNTLDRLARDFNLSLGDVSLSPGIVYKQDDEKETSKKSREVNEKWKTLETELRIIGGRDNIYGFLRQVEKTAPLMIIKDVQMSRVGSQVNNDEFVLTLKLGMVYAEPDIKKIAGGEVKLLTDQDEIIIGEIRDLKSYTLSLNEGNDQKNKLKGVRNDLFKPALEIKSINQSHPHQTEIPQPQLESSSESSESSRASQIQR